MISKMSHSLRPLAFVTGNQNKVIYLQLADTGQGIGNGLDSNGILLKPLTLYIPLTYVELSFSIGSLEFHESHGIVMGK
jgi:hypothetical protein